jgi:tetratricopeptide (TPR) repeat protein
MRVNQHIARGSGTRAIVVVSLAVILSLSPAAAQQDRDSEACFKSNDPDAKIVACTRIIERSQKTKDKHTVGLAYSARASGYESKNELDRAIADYDQAISLIGEVVPASWELAFHYWLRGHVYRTRGDLDRAIADYSESIRVAPKWDKAYNDRGAIYFQKGDYERALADIGQVIAFRPDSPNVAYAYAIRAMVYSKMGQAANGLPDANRAVQLTPNDSFAYFRRAQVFEALGRKDEAIVDYRTALKLKPAAMNEIQEALKRLGSQP